MSSWTGKSRGSLLGYQIVVFSLKALGLKATYVLLRFISFYYFLFAGAPKKHITAFYKQRMGFTPKMALKACRQNFNLLAQSLLDKVALSVGLADKISYSQVGENGLIELAKSGKGGILLSAHVGNWAIAGNLLKGLDVKVNVLLVENEDENLKAFLKSQHKTPQFKTIVIHENLSHLVDIYKALKAGEFVCINADRFLPGNKTFKMNFLNGQAHFPEGVFTLISKLRAQYAVVFAVKESTFKYHFTSTRPKANSDPQLIAQEYVDELEKVIRKNPEQWFNYYDFYSEPQ